jgi:hypothetical protein
MGEVLGQNLLEMAPTEDQDSIETLSAEGPDEVLGERVCSRRWHRRPDNPDIFATEHFVEARSELRVTISEEELDWSGALNEAHAQVAGLLGGPLPHRVGGHASKLGPPGIDLTRA